MKCCMGAGLRRGQLIKWKDDRGFGFVQPADGGPEIFLHISELKDTTRRPQVGDTIYYHAVTAQDGKGRACNAFILGARKKVETSSNSSESAHPNGYRTYPFPVLEVVLLSVLPLLGSVHCAVTMGNFIPLLVYPAMSLLTFGVYKDDKNRAKRKDWRTSEKTLHMYELVGGWPGGFIAQRMLHHKSTKSSYQAVFWTIVILHQVFWVDWLLFGGLLVRAFLGGNFTQ